MIRATPEQRRQWEEEGYLVLEEALVAADTRLMRQDINDVPLDASRFYLGSHFSQTTVVVNKIYFSTNKR